MRDVVCPGCRDASRRVALGSRFFPFCSRECKDRDLEAWASESYRLPVAPSRPEEEHREFERDEPPDR